MRPSSCLCCLERRDRMQKYKLKQVDVRLRLCQAKPLYSTEPVSTPEQAMELMALSMRDLDREYCMVLNLDSGNRPINFNIVSIGDVNQTQVPIQNLFKAALLSNAAYILVLHNHTGGSLKPSTEDIRVTRRMVDAGRLMNIPVIDHVIIAGDAPDMCVSLRKCLPELWKEEIYEERTDNI